MKILVIDDDQLICRSLLRGLKKHQVCAEADARIAIQRALHDSYDVILCDLGMPVVDGLTILATLRTLMTQVPLFVIMSGQPLDIVPPDHMIPDLVLQKPFSASELEDRLDSLVAQRNAV